MDCNFKIKRNIEEYELMMPNTPKIKKNLVGSYFNERWWAKESVDDFIKGYIDKIHFRKIEFLDNSDIVIKNGNIERIKNDLEIEKEEILKDLNKTKKEFVEDVNSSRVEKIRFLLDYMFSDDCSAFRFERLVKSFSIAKGTINSQPTYTLVFDGEILGETKGKKRDVERLFESVTSTLNLGVQCEKTISEDGKTYFFNTDRDAESKLETGDYLTDEEIFYLYDKYEVIVKEKNTKQNRITTVINIDGNLYAVDWDNENDKLIGQPYKCEIKTNIRPIN